MGLQQPSPQLLQRCIRSGFDLLLDCRVIRGQLAWHVAALRPGGAFTGQTAAAQHLGNVRDTDGQPLRDLPHGDCLVRCQEHPITQILGVWFAILPSHCSLRRCSKPEPYGSYPGGVSEPPISAWLGFRSGGKRSRCCGTRVSAYPDRIGAHSISVLARSVCWSEQQRLEVIGRRLGSGPGEYVELMGTNEGRSHRQNRLIGRYWPRSRSPSPLLNLPIRQLMENSH